MNHIRKEKGVIRKYNFNARTLDDNVVRDGLKAVSLLKEPHYLVGGIATQNYIPTTCRRPTSDVDFSVVRPLNYENFKSMVSNVKEFLCDIGYTAETKKRSRSYSLDIFDANNEGLCLEFARRNDQNFKKNKKKLERELEQANNKIIEGRDATYKVCRPEDIAIPKLVRLISSLRRNSYLSRYISGEIDALTEEGIKRQLKEISDIREEVVSNISNPALAEELRFASDLYDIRILSELTGFNEKYLAEVIEDWNTFKDHSNEREKLVKAVLPKFL
tara:strand:- start:2175 stop:2999 length:825 start_codon:yes stop_codon:yes gene_type:complete